MSKKSGMLNLPKRISRRRRGSSSNSDRKLRWFSTLSLLNANTLWIMPRPRYGALLNSGLRTMSRSVLPARPKARAERGAAGFFDVHQKLGGIVEPHAGVERHDSRGGFLIVRTEAVRPAVVGVKVGMSLEDEVRLPGEPEARVLEMREHRFGIGSGGGIVGRVGRIVRGCRGSFGLWTAELELERVHQAAARMPGLRMSRPPSATTG